MTVPSPIESVAEFIEVLLQMGFIEAVMRALNECFEITDVRVDMRKNDVRFPLLHGIAVVDESMLFQRRKG